MSRFHDTMEPSLLKRRMRTRVAAAWNIGKNGVSSRNKSAAKGMTNSDHGQEDEPSVIGRQDGIMVAWPATRAECERNAG
jgi:hypothetical protein